MSTGSAHQDVLQFLQDLDTLTPGAAQAAPAESGTSTQDVLSFLDELEGVAPQVSTSAASQGVPPAGAASAPAPQPGSPAPGETTSSTTAGASPPANLPSSLTIPPVSDVPSPAPAPSQQTQTARAVPPVPPPPKSGFVNGPHSLKSPPRSPALPLYNDERASKRNSAPMESMFTQYYGGNSPTRSMGSPPPVPPTPTTPEPTNKRNSALWGSLWSATAKVSAVTASSLTKGFETASKGLETAKAMAEETAKAVSTNDKVKGIMLNVNREQIGKIGSDITKLTQTFVDTIAPPIQHGTGARYLTDNGMPLFASTITVWFCAEAAGGENLDLLHDFLQQTVTEMWLGNALRLCEKVVVNSVKDPHPKTAANLEEAAALVEGTVERLQKLSAANLPQIDHEGAPIDPHANPHQSVYLVVQPFTVKISSLLFDDQPHLQYFILLVADDGFNLASTLSQSVVQERFVEAAPDVAAVPMSPTSPTSSAGGSSGGNGANGTGLKQRRLAKWAVNQSTRVLETALTDVCEEFGFRCQLGDQ
ncbi:hypothetical protein HK104_000648 [Borealophlyctis nickersoniae]|nr:hypothetical protein HK104_000648 [Borealophlyctis nickersoniae]